MKFDEKFRAVRSITDGGGVAAMQPERTEFKGEIDPIEATGCQIENDAVLLCYAETKDWRKCQKELELFKKCMDRHLKERNN